MLTTQRGLEAVWLKTGGVYDHALPPTCIVISPLLRPRLYSEGFNLVVHYACTVESVEGGFTSTPEKNECCCMYAVAGAQGPEHVTTTSATAIAVLTCVTEVEVSKSILAFPTTIWARI